MVAFNFKKQFAPDVKAFRKRCSMRLNKKCQPGDAIQLYTGQRTKKCKKLGEAICTKVYPQTITRGPSFDSMTKIARKDGFKNKEEMFIFFEELYGLPMVLWMHEWKPRTGEQP